MLIPLIMILMILNTLVIPTSPIIPIIAGGELELRLTKTTSRLTSERAPS